MIEESELVNLFKRIFSKIQFQSVRGRNRQKLKNRHYNNILYNME